MRTEKQIKQVVKVFNALHKANILSNKNKHYREMLLWVLDKGSNIRAKEKGIFL